MILKFLVVLAVGKLASFILRKFPLVTYIADKNKYTRELVACDLCFGVWIYTVLLWIAKINIVDFLYIPILSEFLSGAVASFLVWLFVIGWKETFGIFEVITDARTG